MTDTERDTHAAKFFGFLVQLRESLVVYIPLTFNLFFSESFVRSEKRKKKKSLYGFTEITF